MRSPSSDMNTEVGIKITNIQSIFVAAKWSVPLKSNKNRKLEDYENLSADNNKTKATEIKNDSSSPARLIWDGNNYR
jgi:hypothetical protein